MLLCSAELDMPFCLSDAGFGVVRHHDRQGQAHGRGGGVARLGVESGVGWCGGCVRRLLGDLLSSEDVPAVDLQDERTSLFMSAVR